MDKGRGQGADRPQELRRKLGLGVVISLGVGTVIGSSILSSMGEVTVASGCAAVTILAFMVGGVIMVPQNAVATEIIVACLDDRGFYVWFRGAGSRPLAFLYGQTTFWGGDPPSYSIMTLALADYTAFFIPGTTGIDVKLLATALIATFTTINMRSVKVDGKLLTFMTSFKMFLFALLIGVGLFYADKTTISTPAIVGVSTRFRILLTGVSATTWSYAGMATACSMAGEVKGPEKTIPKTLIVTVFAIIAVYTNLAAAVIGLPSMNLLTASSVSVAEAAAQIPVISSAAGVMTTFIVIIVIIASPHGTIMCQSGIEYAVAEDGLFFRKSAEIRSRWETPANFIMYSCTVSIVLVFVADIETLLGFFSFVALYKNVPPFTTMLKLYKEAGYDPSWKCPAWLSMTILFVGVNVILLVSVFLRVPYKSLFSAFIVVAIGLPTYYFWGSRNRKEGRT